MQYSELYKLYADGTSIKDLAVLYELPQKDIKIIISRARQCGWIPSSRNQTPYQEQLAPWTYYHIAAGSMADLFKNRISEEAARTTFSHIKDSGYESIVEFLGELVLDHYFEELLPIITEKLDG